MNKDEIRQAMKSLSEVILNGSSAEVRVLSAPVTGAPLQVKFIGGRTLSVNVYEVDGDFSICIDGLNEEPSWLEELGGEFTTAPIESAS